MPNKLVQGDKLPQTALRIIDGTTLRLPDDLYGRYMALLFYRGNWCPYCIRHLVSFQARLSELETLGVQVVAATADTRETTVAMIKEKGITFPVAYGVTKQDIEAMDPWWTEDQHGLYVQPLELLVLHGGTVFGSIYASGPVGRMDVEEVLNSVRSRERRRLERQAPAGGAASRGGA